MHLMAALELPVTSVIILCFVGAVAGFMTSVGVGVLVQRWRKHQATKQRQTTDPAEPSIHSGHA